MPEFTGKSDLRSYFRTFWRWKFLFLLFLIAVPTGAWVLERGKPNVYTTTALVGVSQTTVNTSLVNGGGSFSTSNVNAIAQLVTTTPVATVAADLLRPPASPSQIVGEVSAVGDPSTNFLRISATDENAQRAAGIANAFARAISQNLERSAVSQIDASISGIRAQLSHVSPGDTATRATLRQQLEQLQAARSTQGSQAAILQSAGVPSTPSGPHLRRTIELALVIGLLLGLGAVALAENADRRLRTPPDLERMTDLPVLASIAPSAFSGNLKTRTEDDEAFHMLRTALRYFNPEHELRSIMITSAGEKEGKTTIATRLALNCAEAGQHVVLVDADLRRAQVSARLGLHPEFGLAEVLAGDISASEATVRYPVEGTGSGTLDVLPAGPPPANAPALLSSGATEALVRELEQRADLVIIDTPAALAVSDSLSLMRLASGVVLVARMNRSSRETTSRLQSMIIAAGGSLAGIVATGVKSGPGYEHYSPTEYAQEGSRGRTGWRRRRSGKTRVTAAPGD